MADNSKKAARERVKKSTKDREEMKEKYRSNHVPTPTADGMYDAPGRRPLGSAYPVESDSNKDDIILMKQRYVADKQPLGTLHASIDDLKYIKKKRETEEYLKEIQLAQYLVGTIPGIREEQIKKVDSLYPEIAIAEKKNHGKYVAFQKRLRDLLRNGLVKSQEDTRLAMMILDPLYILPMTPIWDASAWFLGIADAELGNQIGSTWLSEAYGDHKVGKFVEAAAKNRGMFSPLRYIDLNPDLETTQSGVLQLKIKSLIGRRLYNGIPADDLKSIYMDSPLSMGVDDPKKASASNTWVEMFERMKAYT
jgi:hypothetical protein